MECIEHVGEIIEICARPRRRVNERAQERAQEHVRARAQEHVREYAQERVHKRVWERVQSVCVKPKQRTNLNNMPINLNGGGVHRAPRATAMRR